MSDFKENLRKRIKETEEELGREYLRDCDEESFKFLYQLKEYRDAGTVFCYCGVNLEPNTRHVITNALNAGKTVAVPKITGEGKMEARVIYGCDELRKGTFGIPEPSDITEILPRDMIDLVIIPGIGFDLFGGRVGSGGGYYDRYLEGAHTAIVGLTREKLICERIPPEEHDVRVSILITEKGVRRF